jgi:hypothetical protein
MSRSTIVHEEEATLKVVSSQINEGQIGAIPLPQATLLRVVDLFLIWRASNLGVPSLASLILTTCNY